MHHVQLEKIHIKYDITHAAVGEVKGGYCRTAGF